MITININAALTALQEIERKASNMRPIMLAIGEQLQKSSQDNFKNGSGPDGERWAPNSPVTVKRKGHGRVLTDSGTLNDQIHYQNVTNNGVQIGANQVYAAMQQFGGTKSEFSNLWGDIPARPYLGVSNDDVDRIKDMLIDYFR